MKRNHIAVPFTLGLALLVQAATAQTPARPPRFILPPGPYNLLLSGVALDGSGALTALWTNLDSPAGAFGRRFAGTDAPLGGPFRLDSPRFTGPSGPAAANQRGDVLMTWGRQPAGGASAGFVRRTSPVLPTLTLTFPTIGDVAIDRDGNFVVLWLVSTSGGSRVVGQRYNFNGTARGPRFDVSAAAGAQVRPKVAMNQNTGDFVAVWELRAADGTGMGVYGRRFGFRTGPRGSEFPIYVPAEAERPNSIQSFAPDVAASIDGRFTVVWKAWPAVDILAQRYNSAGAPAGSRLVIADATGTSDGSPKIAMSPRADFVVSWDDGGTSPLWFRLFHRDGSPAGPTVTRQPVGFPYLGNAQLAFGWDGTFVLGWTNFSDEADIGWNLSYQRYSASPGNEICLFRDGHFLCDTGRTGGAPEIDHVFALRGRTPLLGDVDNDGRDDYCLVRGDRFACDTSHDFGFSETSINFGQAGDWPLLGDVDADGRADPCAFRDENRFACDTAHDGGAPELEIVFGEHGDWPLLGDVNGDGRADPCVFRDRRFYCDTAHDGGVAETVIAFGFEDETPALGDVDGDGRADPCTLSSNGIFGCDLGHDGGLADFVLMVDGTGWPLIGNVDGL